MVTPQGSKSWTQSSSGRKERFDGCWGSPLGLLTGPAPEAARLFLSKGSERRDGGEVFANSPADSLDILISCAGSSLCYLQLCWVQVMEPRSGGTRFAEDSYSA